MKRLPLLAALAGLVVMGSIYPRRLDSGQDAWADGNMRKEILAVIDDQKTVWNRGDIESFMKAYWHSRLAHCARPHKSGREDSVIGTALRHCLKSASTRFQ